ncbi:MAG: DUF1549 and DUF1553 domain-containing protein [Planctomycetota bacterium]|nr:DUF1553 domain-containing protein [Planctomycetaceae bacterium]MDQ3329144.1 DUF1549 and DUF1553 domain-containing protein [Planctomycetota bacterium]
MNRFTVLCLAFAAACCMAAQADSEAPAERIGTAWSDARNPVARAFGGERLDLWSLQPVRPFEPPTVEDVSRTCNPVDRFILARLESNKLTLSDEADRRTLARRLAFDLTGLPPEPETVARFIADDRQDAYERLVDELLASPRYGEHAARMWLDVVRYSDSNGFDWDEFRPQAWRFRDYVIRSFNADKPYDRFLIEQLAGDELLDGPPHNAEERDLLIATGYLRLGPHDNAASLFNEQARSRAELLADLVETTGSAMLGLTLSCCRCHDHKYDPLLQADHYRMRAFFEPVKFADELSLDLAEEQEAIRRHNADVDATAERLAKERESLVATVARRLQPPGEEAKPSEEDILKALDSSERKHVDEIGRLLSENKASRRSATTGLLMTDGTDDVPTTHVLEQGDYRTPGQPVEPGFLSAVDPSPAVLASSPNSRTQGRRLTLAKWIASPDNPLTARVIVNRIWQTHFGQGLVVTPNDFGLGGETPTHPELLDWLAADFVREGWSLKRLHRLIVTSVTYRQRSTVEDSATNDVGQSHDGYSRRSIRRLTAEQLRDSLLVVSGLLTSKTDGPPVWPELPEDILQANPAFLDDNETRTKGWYPSAPEEQHARSIFVVQKRTVRVPFLETFDLPENATSCGRRDVSTVAPQASSLLNSPLAVEASRMFAARVSNQAGETPREKVQRAFAIALQRRATPDELVECIAHMRRHGLASLCRVLLNLNEFVYLD